MKRLAVLLFIVALAAPASASAQSFEPLRSQGRREDLAGQDRARRPAYARLDRLADRYGRVGVKAVVESANRDVQSAAGSPSLNQIGAPVQASFKWNDGDNGVDYWIPQGITGSAAATEDGLVGGHRSLVVSWYGPDGARLTFVNADNGFTKYRHVLLVEPSGNSFKPISTHAGGVAWYGDKLYVAETKVGLRVFDTNYFLDATKSPGEHRPGLSLGAAAGRDRTSRTARARCASPRSRPTAAGRRWSPARGRTRRSAGSPCAGRCAATS